MNDGGKEHPVDRLDVEPDEGVQSRVAKAVTIEAEALPEGAKCGRAKCQRTRMPGSDLCEVCVTKCSRCRRTLRYAEHFLDTDRGYRYQADGDDPRYRKCQKCREEAAIARLEQSDGVKKERQLEAMEE